MANQSPDPGWIQYQSRMDDDNLRTLTILFRVYGGIQLALSCCFVAYITFVLGVFGVAASSGPDKAPPLLVGGVLAFVWGIILLIVCGSAILNFLCANWIRDRRNWTGVIVVSAIDCLNVPLGIALGIFTIIVLNRATVKSTFD